MSGPAPMPERPDTEEVRFLDPRAADYIEELERRLRAATERCPACWGVGKRHLDPEYESRFDPDCPTCDGKGTCEGTYSRLEAALRAALERCRCHPAGSARHDKWCLACRADLALLDGAPEPTNG